MTGRGAGVEILDAAAEFDQLSVLTVGGLEGSLGVVDLATPCPALLKPFEDGLRRVELSLCRFEDIDQVMSQDVLKRVATQSVVMEQARECTGERTPRQAAGAGQLPEDGPSTVHVDVEIEVILGKPSSTGFAEDLSCLGPLRLDSSRTEPIRITGLHESGEADLCPSSYDRNDSVGVSLYRRA